MAWIALAALAWTEFVFQLQEEPNIQSLREAVRALWNKPLCGFVSTFCYLYSRAYELRSFARVLRRFLGKAQIFFEQTQLKQSSIVAAGYVHLNEHVKCQAFSDQDQ
jgi:hypothetical protein